MKRERGSEAHRKNMEAAARLAELSIENALRLTAVLAELAQRLLRESVADDGRRAHGEDGAEILRLRTCHAEQMIRAMTDGAHKIAAVGADARQQFSRLLTEQLASGSSELMDAFQSFFKVLPPQNAETIAMIEQAIKRGDGAFEQIAAAVAAAGGEIPEPARRPRLPGQHRHQAVQGPIPVRASHEPRAC